MLQIRHLEKILDGRSALAIDALDCAAGEIVAVIGPAGCGKTLLLRILAGLVPPSGGSVVLDGGHAPLDQKNAHRQVGVLFEDDLLYARQSAQSNLAFYCRLLGLPTTCATDALVLVGLSDQAQRAVKKLNASAQRRLAFARVAGKLDTFTPAKRRQTLLTLKTDVRLYRTGHTPHRAEGTIALPLSGVLALELSGLGNGSTSPARYGVEHSKAVIQYTRNSYTLQLNDAQGTSIPLSRQSERELHDLLGY